MPAQSQAIHHRKYTKEHEERKHKHYKVVEDMLQEDGYRTVKNRTVSHPHISPRSSTRGRISIDVVGWKPDDGEDKTVSIIVSTGTLAHAVENNLGRAAKHARIFNEVYIAGGSNDVHATEHADFLGLLRNAGIGLINTDTQNVIKESHATYGGLRITEYFKLYFAMQDAIESDDNSVTFRGYGYSDPGIKACKDGYTRQALDRGGGRYGVGIEVCRNLVSDWRWLVNAADDFADTVAQLPDNTVLDVEGNFASSSLDTKAEVGTLKKDGLRQIWEDIIDADIKLGAEPGTKIRLHQIIDSDDINSEQIKEILKTLEPAANFLTQQDTDTS